MRKRELIAVSLASFDDVERRRAGIASGFVEGIGERIARTRARWKTDRRPTEGRAGRDSTEHGPTA